MQEPLSSPEVKELIRRISTDSGVIFSKHAREEMMDDGLSERDVLNVLRGGWPSPGEFENGSYRYRVSTQTICVVVAFPCDDRVVVVTAWRI